LTSVPDLELDVPPTDSSTTKPLTGTYFHILLALADEERYGLGIIQEVERRSDGDVQLGPGTLYNAVKQMLDEGLIEESPPGKKRASDDPRRRYYRITRAGRAKVRREAVKLERLVRTAKQKSVLPARR
jgi:DNA-binding PadR family transcriptional regulator